MAPRRNAIAVAGDMPDSTFQSTEHTMRKSLAGIVVAFLVFTGSISAATGQTDAKYVWGNDPDGGIRFYQEQKTDRWCWAATAAMIMAFHGQPQWLQCIQADDAFPGKSLPRTCCDKGEDPLCNRTGWPHFRYYGFNSEQTNTPLTWNELKNQIDRGLPVAVAVKFYTNGGHMGVVVGYQLGPGGQQQIMVVDPDGFHTAIVVAFDDIFGEADDGLYKHWRTFFNIYPIP